MQILASFIVFWTNNQWCQTHNSCSSSELRAGSLQASRWSGFWSFCGSGTALLPRKFLELGRGTWLERLLCKAPKWCHQFALNHPMLPVSPSPPSSLDTSLSILESEIAKLPWATRSLLHTCQTFCPCHPWTFIQRLSRAHLPAGEPSCKPSSCSSSTGGVSSRMQSAPVSSSGLHPTLSFIPCNHASDENTCGTDLNNINLLIFQVRPTGIWFKLRNKFVSKWLSLPKASVLSGQYPSLQPELWEWAYTNFCPHANGSISPELPGFC